MGKTTVQNKRGIITVQHRITMPESVNEQVASAIYYGSIEGFLPVAVEKKRKETVLTCVVQGLLPIRDYLGTQVSRSRFLAAAIQITRLLQVCVKSRLNPINLDLEDDRIFVDPTSGAVRCIYWPIVNNQTVVPTFLYLQQLPQRLTFAPEEDPSYLREYQAFFDGRSPFSVNGFERLLLRLQGQPERQPQGGNQGSRTNGGPQDYGGQIRQEEIAYDPEAALRAEVRREVEQQRATRPPEVPVSQPMRPRLIRVRTNETVWITKPLFRLGKSRTICDYCITDNQYVSKNHADLVNRGNRFFLVDRNSLNGTILNGTPVQPGVEMPLNPGDTFELADEVFTFFLN